MSWWLGRVMTNESAANTAAAAAPMAKIAGSETPASWSGPAPKAAMP